jgi:hypothetical protein
MRACGDGLALVIPAHQVCRDRESLEVLGVERCVAIGGLQQPIRFGPRPLLERLPPTGQGGEVRHIARLETVDRSGSLVSTTLTVLATRALWHLRARITSSFLMTRRKCGGGSTREELVSGRRDADRQVGHVAAGLAIFKALFRQGV